MDSEETAAERPRTTRGESGRAREEALREAVRRLEERVRQLEAENANLRRWLSERSPRC